MKAYLVPFTITGRILKVEAEHYVYEYAPNEKQKFMKSGNSVYKLGKQIFLTRAELVERLEMKRAAKVSQLEARLAKFKSLTFE